MRKFKTVIFVVVLLYAISLTASYVVRNTADKQLAVIPIYGAITNGHATFPLTSQSITAETIIAFIEAAEENGRVKGILLDINSPGGTVVASKDIARAVKATTKPTVAVIRDIGTSGAYWVASAADKIVADELSITGSIGVTASYLEFSDLFEEYGITYTQLKAGEHKEMGSPFKALTSPERDIIQKKIESIHEAFIQEIATNRNLSLAKVRTLADGSYLLGQEALIYGLIDDVGGKKQAINILKEYAGIPQDEEIDLVEYQQEVGVLDLISQLETKTGLSLDALRADLKLSQPAFMV